MSRDAVAKLETEARLVAALVALMRQASEMSADSYRQMWDFEAAFVEAERLLDDLDIDWHIKPIPPS